MDGTKYRAWGAIATVALFLAGGPMMAAAQTADQPEWQQYDQLDERYGPLAWLTFGEVIGSQVVDEQGQPVGEIVHLVRAKDDGMFYAVMDTAAAAGEGDQVVPLDHLEVVGETEQDRQIVLTGEGTGDFDASDFEAAPPPGEAEQQG